MIYEYHRPNGQISRFIPIEDQHDDRVPNALDLLRRMRGFWSRETTHAAFHVCPATESFEESDDGCAAVHLQAAGIIECHFESGHVWAMPRQGRDLL